MNGNNIISLGDETFDMILNGKDMRNRNYLKIRAFECKENCGAAKVEGCKVMEASKLWSDPNTWPDQKVP